MSAFLSRAGSLHCRLISPRFFDFPATLRSDSNQFFCTMDRSWMQLHNRSSPRYIDGMREFIMFAHNYMKPDKRYIMLETKN
ncbi:unnamed protein product [Camellia sinensis]